MNRYLTEFTAHVVELLGGEDMAREFFQLHPELRTKLRLAALYHEGKGGAAHKGAAIFNRFDIRPVLRADQRRAWRKPIGGIDRDTDARR